MKTARYLALFLSLSAAVSQLPAQCPASPSNPLTFGTAPSDLPCIQRGNAYHEYLRVYGGFSGLMYSTVAIDSITGLPDGITYQITQQSCIELSGITFDPVGLDTIEIHGTFEVYGDFGGPIFTANKLSDICNGGCIMCFPSGQVCPGNVILQVINPGDDCCAISSQYSRIQGVTYFDADTNGVFDSTDYRMAHQKVFIDSTVIFSNANGEYEYQVLTGNYSISMDVPALFSLTNGPPTYSLSIQDTCSATFSGFDFGLKPDTIIDDVSINLSIGAARPGFRVTHHLNFSNLGTTILSDTITLHYDARFSFVLSSPPPDSQSGNTLKWAYSALTPGSLGYIMTILQVPQDITLVNDTLRGVAYIGPDDSNNYNNTSNATRVITAAIDPNEKTLAPETWKTGMLPDSLMHYTIFFQNTGNDTAFTVEIRDTLDGHLDFSTFRHVGQSHPNVSLTVSEEKYLTWTFYNILLPDSNINEQASHGFVSFDIKPLPELQHGLLIENNAAIYFDYNPPVITNTTTAKILYSCPVQLPDTIAACVGDELFLEAGAGSLSFLWSTGDTVRTIAVTPFEDVSYSVTASNAYGCADTGSVSIKVAAAPLSIQSTGTEICAGNFVTLVAEGGSSYLWSTGDDTDFISVTPLEDITYSVTVLNSNGCPDTASAMIKVLPLPSVSILSHIAEICSGDTALLVAQGGGDYFWSTWDTNSVLAISQPGVYAVTVTNEFECYDADSVIITSAGDAPVADFNFSLSNDTVRFEDLSVDADDYFWTFGDSATSNDVQPEHIFSNGAHEVCLTVVNICGSDNVCKTITVTSTGNYPQSAQSSVKVYEADHRVYVQLMNSFHAIRSIHIFNAAGQEMISMQLKPNTQSATINTAGLAAGIYLCSVNLSNGQKVVKRIAVR